MIKFTHIALVHFLFMSLIVMATTVHGQVTSKVTAPTTSTSKKKNNTILLYGQASYYAPKFEGRKTATGERFGHGNATAACNVLPLGTWVKVTNLRNGRSIVVRTNDRLHPKTKRIIDLSKTGAQKLGYIKQGLTRVKIEVLRGKPK